MGSARTISIEGELLGSFDDPIALSIEVTKQGVVLSKLRYLKALGSFINETINCPNIELYLHTGNFIDTHIEKGGGRPAGIDYIYKFKMRKRILRQVVGEVYNGKLQINSSNPNITDKVENVHQMIDRHFNPEKYHNGKRSIMNVKKLTGVEEGILLEPYCAHICNTIMQERHHLLLQNVQLLRQNYMRAAPNNGGKYVDYVPRQPPTMEIDILLIIEIKDLSLFLEGLSEYGYHKATF